MKAKILLIASLMIAFSGCSSWYSTPLEKGSSATTFKAATRQLAPEPVYNRVAWVHLPAPLPSRQTGTFNSPTFETRFEVELSDATLQEVAQALAAPYGYRVYCAGDIADQKVDLQGIGTINEFADILEKKAGIKVIIDHDMRDIRFLAGTFNAPRFYEDEDLNEYQSTN